METQITLSEAAFIALFQPLKNVVNPDASFDFGAGGIMYDIDGDDHDHIIAQPLLHIWTICTDGPHGDYITSGYHHADQLGYILTQHPAPEGINIIVELPNEDNEDNIHYLAAEFAERVYAVIGTLDYTSSHCELDIEYHLYQMLGEAKALSATTQKNGTAAPISCFYELLSALEERFSRYETECKEFIAEMEACDA